MARSIVSKMMFPLPYLFVVNKDGVRTYDNSKKLNSAQYEDDDIGQADYVTPDIVQEWRAVFKALMENLYSGGLYDCSTGSAPLGFGMYDQGMYQQHVDPGTYTHSSYFYTPIPQVLVDSGEAELVLTGTYASPSYTLPEIIYKMVHGFVNVYGKRVFCDGVRSPVVMGFEPGFSVYVSNPGSGAILLRKFSSGDNTILVQGVDWYLDTSWQESPTSDSTYKRVRIDGSYYVFTEAEVIDAEKCIFVLKGVGSSPGGTVAAGKEVYYYTDNFSLAFEVTEQSAATMGFGLSGTIKDAAVDTTFINRTYGVASISDAAYHFAGYTYGSTSPYSEYYDSEFLARNISPGGGPITSMVSPTVPLLAKFGALLDDTLEAPEPYANRFNTVIGTTYDDFMSADFIKYMCRRRLCDADVLAWKACLFGYKDSWVQGALLAARQPMYYGGFIFNNLRQGEPLALLVNRTNGSLNWHAAGKAIYDGACNNANRIISWIPRNEDGAKVEVLTGTSGSIYAQNEGKSYSLKWGLAYGPNNVSTAYTTWPVDAVGGVPYQVVVDGDTTDIIGTGFSRTDPLSFGSPGDLGFVATETSGLHAMIGGGYTRAEYPVLFNGFKPGVGVVAKVLSGLRPSIAMGPVYTNIYGTYGKGVTKQVDFVTGDISTEESDNNSETDSEITTVEIGTIDLEHAVTKVYVDFKFYIVVEKLEWVDNDNPPTRTGPAASGFFIKLGSETIATVNMSSSTDGIYDVIHGRAAKKVSLAAGVHSLKIGMPAVSPGDLADPPVIENDFYAPEIRYFPFINSLARNFDVFVNIGFVVEEGESLLPDVNEQALVDESDIDAYNASVGGMQQQVQSYPQYEMKSTFILPATCDDVMAGGCNADQCPDQLLIPLKYDTILVWLGPNAHTGATFAGCKFIVTKSMEGDYFNTHSKRPENDNTFIELSGCTPCNPVAPSSSITMYHLGGGVGTQLRLNQDLDATLSVSSGNSVYNSGTEKGMDWLIVYDDVNEVPGYIPILVTDFIAAVLPDFGSSYTLDHVYYHKGYNRHSVLQASITRPLVLSSYITLATYAPTHRTGKYIPPTSDEGPFYLRMMHEYLTSASINLGQETGVWTFQSDYDDAGRPTVEVTAVMLEISATELDANAGDSMTITNTAGIEWKPQLCEWLSKLADGGDEASAVIVDVEGTESLFTTSDRITWTLTLPPGWQPPFMGGKLYPYVIVGQLNDEYCYAVSPLFRIQVSAQTDGSGDASPSTVTNGGPITIDFGDVTYRS